MAISGTQYYTNAINGNSHISLSGKIGSGWGFYQPSYDLVNAHMVDENGLPYLDKSYQSKTSVTTIDGDNVPHTDLTVYTDPRVICGSFQCALYGLGYTSYYRWLDS